MVREYCRIARHFNAVLVKNRRYKPVWVRLPSGYPDGMNNVGVMYHFGLGVKKDDVAAKHWLTKAANIGVKRAKQALADFFESDDAYHSQSKV